MKGTGYDKGQAKAYRVGWWVLMALLPSQSNCVGRENYVQSGSCLDLREERGDIELYIDITHSISI